MTALSIRPARLPGIEWRSAGAGLVAALALVGVYLLIVTVAQGADHAVELFAADAPFVLAIAAGFGIQIALFTELRAVHARHRSATAMTAAGTGTSVAAMLACCAHHLADLLPIIGLSGHAVFLNAYKTPLLWLGIATNLVGIVILARQLRQARRACDIGPATLAPVPTARPDDPSAASTSDAGACH